MPNLLDEIAAALLEESDKYRQEANFARMSCVRGTKSEEPVLLLKYRRLRMAAYLVRKVSEDEAI